MAKNESRRISELLIRTTLERIWWSDYSTHSNLTWDIIVDQARLLQAEKYPDLTRVGKKAENTVNLDFVRNILNEKGWGKIGRAHV